jgi:hypothetical protein
MMQFWRNRSNDVNKKIFTNTKPLMVNACLSKKFKLVK